MKRMKEEADRAEQEQRARDAVKGVEMQHYKQDLHRQMEEKEYTKQKAYEEFLKEKLLIDEIVRKIYEEDQKEIERKMLAQKVGVSKAEYAHSVTYSFNNTKKNIEYLIFLNIKNVNTSLMWIYLWGTKQSNNFDVIFCETIESQIKTWKVIR